MIGCLKFLDFVFGSALCTILAPFRLLKRKPKRIKKILIIKLWAIGESILTLPLLYEAKRLFPEARVDVLARKYNYRVYVGHADNILLFEPHYLFSLLRKIQSYDVVFDCEPYVNCSAILSFLLGRYNIGFDPLYRSCLYAEKVHYNDQQHVVLTYLDMLKGFGKVRIPERLPELKFGTEAKEKIKKLLKGKKRIIGMCPGVGSTTKERAWPIERFVQLSKKLSKEGFNIVVIGGKEDSELAAFFGPEVIDLIGRIDFEELFALCKFCDIFISNDTGPMHVAAAQGCKTIGLFGPESPKRFAPYGKGNISIHYKMSCSPCINVHLRKFARCKRHAACMDKISVHEVYAAIKGFASFKNYNRRKK